jgi:hypothetical protein
MPRIIFVKGTKAEPEWAQKVENFIEDFTDGTATFITNIKAKLGYGTMANQNSDAVSITGGNISNVTLTNVTGAAGPTGPQGPAGPQGPQGLQGVQGPAGPSSGTSFNGVVMLATSSANINDVNVAITNTDPATVDVTKTVSLDPGNYRYTLTSSVASDGESLTQRTFTIAPGTATLNNSVFVSLKQRVSRAGSNGYARNPCNVKLSTGIVTVVAAGTIVLAINKVALLGGAPTSDEGSSFLLTKD